MIKSENLHSTMYLLNLIAPYTSIIVRFLIYIPLCIY